MLFHLILELLLEVADELLKVDDLALLHVKFLLDLNFFSIQRAVFLGLLSCKVVYGLFMVLTLCLQLVSECIEGSAKRFDPTPHRLDLILIFPQFPSSLGGLFALAFFNGALVFLKLLIRFFFFFF